MPLDGFPVVGFSPKAPNVYLAPSMVSMVAIWAIMETMDGATVDLLGDYRPSRFDQRPYGAYPFVLE